MRDIHAQPTLPTSTLVEYHGRDYEVDFNASLGKFGEEWEIEIKSVRDDRYAFIGHVPEADWRQNDFRVAIEEQITETLNEEGYSHE